MAQKGLYGVVGVFTNKVSSGCVATVEIVVGENTNHGEKELGTKFYNTLSFTGNRL
jgi:hypothetical protein